MLTHWLEQLFDAHMGKSEGATTNREEYLIIRVL